MKCRECIHCEVCVGFGNTTAPEREQGRNPCLYYERDKRMKVERVSLPELRREQERKRGDGK